MELNEQDGATLDKEFNQNLQLLEPFIHNLLEEETAALCDEWIEKLRSNCEPAEKYLRNKYLYLLCCQLSSNYLDEPFLSSPPPGNLTPLFIEENKCSDECESIVSREMPNDLRMSLKTIWAFNRARDLHAKVQEVGHLINKSESYAPVSQPVVTAMFQETLQPTEPPTRNNGNDERVTVAVANISMENIPQFINESPMREKSNAFDVESYGMFEKLVKIKQLSSNLTDELSGLTNPKSPITKENILHIFVDEVNCLNSKLENLLANKVQLQQSHNAVRSKWECAVEQLARRLQNAQTARLALLKALDALETKIKAVETTKDAEIQESTTRYKLAFDQLKKACNEEVLTLKDECDERLHRMDDYYKNKIRALECQHAERVISLSRKHDEAITEHQENRNRQLNVKDNEISRLENVIQDQCNRLQSQVMGLRSRMTDKCPNEECSSLREKIELLHKQLIKMDKLRSKTIKNLEGKIVILLRERHMMECNLQLQLLKQRAELLAQTTEDGKEEVAHAVISLESKYREIVAAIQIAAIKKRFEDQQSLDNLTGGTCSMGSMSEQLQPGHKQGFYADVQPQYIPTSDSKDYTVDQQRDNSSSDPDYIKKPN